MVITGAGVSSGSGIPTYRDSQAQWKHSTPIQHQAFIDDLSQRQRYWARSAMGWPTVEQAVPNAAHLALVALEQMGRITLLVTQNVDRLHQAAGQLNTVDLHGRLDQVVCLKCRKYESRQSVQNRLLNQNSQLSSTEAKTLPDGDSAVSDVVIESVHCPLCQSCSSVLMPDVVFFGGTVPKERVKICMDALEQSDALLVVGSSVMVHSSYRFCKAARELSKPIAVLNQGKTRADDILTLKIDDECSSTLSQVVAML